MPAAVQPPTTPHKGSPTDVTLASCPKNCFSLMALTKIMLAAARQRAVHTGLPIALASVACCAIHLVAKLVEASCHKTSQPVSGVSDWGYCCSAAFS